MASVQPERRKAPRANDPELRGRRATPRARIALQASVETLTGRNGSSLLDLSCMGAHLEGPNLPAVGREVILDCGETDMFGTIVWAAGDQCGIRFDEPISAQQVDDVRSVSDETARSGKTPDELQAAADWLNGLAR